MKAVPHYCPVCKHRGSYYGRLVFPAEMNPDLEGFDGPPICPNHKRGYEHELEPVTMGIPRQQETE